MIVSVLARVCLHKRNHSEVKRGRESLGPGLHMSWIVELHASTITEQPRIHKSDCLLPDFYTHGWLRQLPVSPLHSLTARDDKIRWRICITLKNSRL